eukprot:350556-Chlamydomonas_euryale.AAC.24
MEGCHAASAVWRAVGQYLHAGHSTHAVGCMAGCDARSHWTVVLQLVTWRGAMIQRLHGGLVVGC